MNASSQPEMTATDDDVMFTDASWWVYAMEAASGPDGIEDAARYLRRIGSPLALRTAELFEAGSDLIRIELQVTRWINAGLTTHNLHTLADVEGLAAAHELPADLDAATVQQLLLDTPDIDRLYYWQNCSC